MSRMLIVFTMLIFSAVNSTANNNGFHGLALCIDKQLKSGEQYSSKDGGMSVLKLRSFCEKEWNASVVDCEHSGKSQKECALDNVLTIQGVLVMRDSYYSGK